MKKRKHLISRLILSTLVAATLHTSVLPVHAAAPLVWTQMDTVTIEQQSPDSKPNDNKPILVKNIANPPSTPNVIPLSAITAVDGQTTNTQADPIMAAIEEIQKRRQEDDAKLKQLIAQQKEQQELRKKQQKEQEEQRKRDEITRQAEQEAQKKAKEQQDKDQLLKTLADMQKQQIEQQIQHQQTLAMILESLKSQQASQQNQQNQQTQALVTALEAMKPAPNVPVTRITPILTDDEPTVRKTVEQYISDNTQDANEAPSREADVTFFYSDAALYRIYTKEGNLTDIQLQPGEEIEYIGGGDTTRWVIDKAQSGSGENRRWHIYIKPITNGITTNIVINTNKHSYQLVVKTTNSIPNPIIRWTYPQEEKAAFMRQKQQIQKLDNDSVDLGMANPDDLEFGYQIKSKGETSGWKPTMVFANKKSGKTFIKMPESLRTSEAPVLFLKNGKKLLIVNYRVKNNYYIVDRLFNEAEMRVGDATVQIKKGDD